MVEGWAHARQEVVAGWWGVCLCVCQGGAKECTCTCGASCQGARAAEPQALPEHMLVPHTLSTHITTEPTTHLVLPPPPPPPPVPPPPSPLLCLGPQVKEVHEEEWSYIPVGGPLPAGDQYLTAFGAAANLVHPATGESNRRGGWCGARGVGRGSGTGGKTGS
jgi:hypothetical protein